MGAGKWIGGFLGWVTLGPIGALLGFWFGSAVDDYIERSWQLPGDDSSNTRTYSRTTYTASEQRNSFLVSLLVLSAAVIKADGKTLQAELDYVKDWYARNYDNLCDHYSTNGIDSIHSDESSSSRSGIYTLDGRREDGNTLQKGIYIVNGKKVVVK